MNEGDLAALSPLKGHKATLTMLGDHIQLECDNGWTLHIYNAATLAGLDVAGMPANPVQTVFYDFEYDQRSLRLIFLGGAVLSVDMSDDGYQGPEAMQLNGPDGSIVIWN